MITEIPTASEFQEAGLNQLYLAWQIAMQAVQDYEEAQQLAYEMNEDEAAAAAAAYWSKSQPVLANAFGTASNGDGAEGPHRGNLPLSIDCA
jgi:hypothetical protein